jgi:hypothetical protein
MTSRNALMYGTRLAQLLRAIANSIERLDETQLNEFISSLKRPRSAPPIEKSTGKKKHAKVDPAELDRIIMRLNEAISRDEGEKLLEGLELSRKELERLARLRDIHISKDDNVTKIKEKLVEVIIGSRLSSRAIRGQ